MANQDLRQTGNPILVNTRVNGNTFLNGKIRGNRTIIYSTTNDFDVSNISELWVNSSAGNIDINGFSGGIENQIIFLSKVSGANTANIIHNSGTGTQKILTADGMDLDLQTYGGIPLIYNGSNWYVIRLT